MSCIFGLSCLWDVGIHIWMVGCGMQLLRRLNIGLRMSYVVILGRVDLRVVDVG